MISLSKPAIGDAEREAVLRVLDSGMLAQGPEVAAFETEFSTAVDGRRCVAVNAGTSALHVALAALGIGPGDEVIVPSFTFAATANSVRIVGADPVFVDIDPANFCLSPAAIEAAISDRTRAVMPVHLYGHPADMTAISGIAERHNLKVIEDAAQAHLASWNGVPVGAWGDAAAFSFYPTKNMMSGEGGMIVVHDPEVERTCRLLRNQGMERRYANEIVGYNLRMTDLHAAIGRAQFGQLCEWTVARQANAAHLSANLRGVITPLVAAEANHVYHQYTVRVEGGHRDDFAAALEARGVGCGVYYPTPVHRLPSFNADIDLPETERAAAECLSLPVHPALTAAELDVIVTAVNEVAEGG